MKPGKPISRPTTRSATVPKFSSQVPKSAGKTAAKTATRQAITPDFAKISEIHRKEKERQDALANFGPYVPYMELTSGENLVRFLPPYTDEGPNAKLWFRQMFTHYNVAGKEDPGSDVKFHFSCAVMTPDASHFLKLPKDMISCPVCSYRKELLATGNPEDAELAKQYKAKLRYVSNVVDLTDPVWTKKAIEKLKAEKKIMDKNLPKVGSPKIQTLTYGPTVWEILINVFQSCDFTNLDIGRNIQIKKEGVGLNTNYVVLPELETSPAPITVDDYDLIHDLDNHPMLKFLTNEQIELILEGGTKEEVFSLKEGGAPAAKQLTTSKTTKTAPAVEDIEEDVDEEEYTDEEEVEEDAEEYEEEELASDEEIDQAYEESVEADEEGDLDYESISDEDIENEDHEAHVECFGKEAIHDPNDEGCTECALFDRCGDRVSAKKINKKQASKGKVGRPGKPVPSATTPAPAPELEKPKAGRGRPAGSTKTKPPVAAVEMSELDALEAEMNEALGKKR